MHEITIHSFPEHGITQMYALKYGTVPIVSSVGRLDDSIQSLHDKTGAGFKFALLNDR
jgi:glycogen synthase